MNTVTFPGLGLTFDLPRVAFSIGSFHIYWYGVIIAIGFVAGTVFCVRHMAHRLGLWFVHRGRQRFDGELFLRYVAWYGLGRGFIEGLRTDSLYLFSTGIRTSQLLAFVSCAAAVCFLIWKRHGHADPNERYCERTKGK